MRESFVVFQVYVLRIGSNEGIKGRARLFAARVSSRFDDRGTITGSEWSDE